MTTPQAALLEALTKIDLDLSRILHELAGSASMCWSETPKGVFESSQAIGFVESAIAEIRGPLRAALAQAEAAQPEWSCYCDERGIGTPGVTCGDCPRDYGHKVAAPKQEAVAPMSDQQATLLNQAHNMLLEHADEQRKRGNDSAAAGAECSAAAVLELGAAWSAAQPQQPAPEPVARVPLTQEQIVMDGMMMCPNATMANCADAFEAGARFAERAHGIAAPQTPATTGDTEGRA